MSDPTAKTYAERLVLVKNAIDQILVSGQNVSYQGRSLGMANLAELRKLESDYTTLANEEALKCGAGRSRISYVIPI